MRAVVKVKPVGGNGASRVARYIAESKLDPVREGKRRPLFSDREDDLSGGEDRTYRAANRYLTGGRSAPRKCDLIHFSVSFREEDFERLGAGDDERKGRLREAAREAMAEIQADLNVAGWRWIVGIHLNTPHPHVHIVIHKEVTDRKTALPRRLGNLPKRMLPHSERGADGAIRSVAGGVAGHFIAALELAQERARETERAREEKAMALTTEQTRKESQARWTDRLLEAASRNPSLAGRDLAMEIIARGPAPESGERFNPADDIRDALRNRSLDDSEYQTQIEQAGQLGKHSKELRDLYERGAEIKGETLIIPAEEYEVPGEGDHIRVINISHAFEKIRDQKTAVEFHSLARSIAGETADTETEIKVFKHYYDQIERDADGRRLDRNGDGYERERASALDRTLAEMRLLAGEMVRLETRASIDIVPSITERSHVYRHIQDYERASEFYSLARAIIGPDADLQRESQVFSYYYGKLDRDGEGHRLTPDNEAGRLEAVERTLRVSEAVGLAVDESQLRPPGPDELAEARRILIELCAHEKSELERRRELRSRLETSDRRDPGEGQSRVSPDRLYIFNERTDSRLGQIERLIEGLQKSQVETGAGRGSAHPSDSRLYVSLSNNNDAPRLPAGNIRVYDAIERMATGAKLQLSTWIGKDGPTLINGFTEKEYDYRLKVAGFLKSYVHERLRDPETRFIHDNEIFRNAHKALDQARTYEELNRVAYDFMSRNEREGKLLSERERQLLFYSRAPDHDTPGMIRLRQAWGCREKGESKPCATGDCRLLRRSSRWSTSLNRAATSSRCDSIGNP